MFAGRYFPLTYYPTRYFAKIGSGAIIGVRAYAVISFAVAGGAESLITVAYGAFASEE